jgi:hypothetical protein
MHHLWFLKRNLVIQMSHVNNLNNKELKRFVNPLLQGVWAYLTLPEWEWKTAKMMTLQSYSFSRL